MAAASTRPTARLIAKIARQSPTARTTAPKTGPSTLPASWTAETMPEGYGAALRRVEVGDQGQGGRHQAAAAETLQEPAGDHRRHVVGQGGDEGAEGEDHQCGDQHRGPAPQVGDPTDQRQHGDVAEQEAGDDRGGALQLLGGDADGAHHLGERQDDDVGVGRSEGDSDGREGEQRPRATRATAIHGAVMSCSVP